MLLVPDRLQCRHRRMQSEKPIQILYHIARNIDGRTQSVVCRFAMWNNDVQAVRSAALENDYQPFRTLARMFWAEGRAPSECRNACEANNRDGTLSRKNSRGV